MLRFLTRRAAVALIVPYVALRADERLDETLKRLRDVKQFALGGVGVAGVISEGETGLKLVLSNRPRLRSPRLRSFTQTVTIKRNATHCAASRK
jgi:hypothetical protein